MKNRPLLPAVMLGLGVMAYASEPEPPVPRTEATVRQKSYDALIAERVQEGLSFLQSHGWPSADKNPDFKQHLALLLLFKNEKVTEANRMILDYCGLGQMTTYVGKPVPKNRSEALFRIYLLERTHRLLSPQARTAIEDYAWEYGSNKAVIKYPAYDDVALEF